MSEDENINRNSYCVDSIMTTIYPFDINIHKNNQLPTKQNLYIDQMSQDQDDLTIDH